MKRTRIYGLLAVFLILSLAACTGVSGPALEEPSPVVLEATPMDAEESHTETTDADQESDDEAVPIDAAAIFSARCSSCHGPTREGANGPPLLPETLTKDPSIYVNTITNGSGPMPSWESRLSADEINALVEFIRSEVK